MKFKFLRKGTITQGYDGNANPSYAKQGQASHGAVDWFKGYGTPVQVDNPGVIYKISYARKSPSNWQAIYQLVPNGKNEVMEVVMGHLSEVWVSDGQKVPEDYFIGAEGNKGTVYSGGKLITPKMQKAGDRRGSHVHESYRPCRKVKKTKRSEYYLLKDGKKYKDSRGYYYEIIEKDNGRNGRIDPRKYDYVESNYEKISNLTGVVKYLKKFISAPNGAEPNKDKKNMQFVSTSRTGVGMLVFILTSLASLLGLDVDNGQITEASVGLLNFVSLILMLWGQFDRKDLKWGIWRK